MFPLNDQSTYPPYRTHPPTEQRPNKNWILLKALKKSVILYVPITATGCFFGYLFQHLLRRRKCKKKHFGVGSKAAKTRVTVLDLGVFGEIWRVEGGFLRGVHGGPVWFPNIKANPVMIIVNGFMNHESWKQNK